MKKSKIFFILTIIGIVITITFIGFSIYHYSRASETVGSSWTIEKKEELDKKFTYENEKEEFFEYSAIATGGISGIFLITGIILKVKEKGGIKIVD